MEHVLHALMFFCFVPQRHVKAVSSNEGKEFMLALPMVISKVGSVQFYISTMSTKDITVLFSMPHHPSKKTPLEIKLPRRSIFVHTEKEIFRSNERITTKWTYRLESAGMISLTVVLCSVGTSFATIQALPVEGWGKKYSVITLRSMPSIQITAAENAAVEVTLTVTVHFRSQLNRYQKLLEQLKNLLKNNKKNMAPSKAYWNNLDPSTRLGLALEINLETKWETLSVSDCDRRVNTTSQTGSIVEATAPIGVISGNCLSDTEVLVCTVYNDRPDAVGQPNVVADAMLPSETYGREFIIFHVMFGMQYGLVTVAATEPRTLVTFIQRKEGVTNFGSYRLTDTGSWISFSGPSYAFKLSGSKPIVVSYALRSPCMKGAAHGAPEFTLVLPTRLFYNAYYWRTLNITTRYIFLHYANIIVEKEHRAFITINDLLISNGIAWEEILDMEQWTTGTTRLQEGSHLAAGAEPFPFGLYLYGLGSNGGYIHPAGFMASPINARCSSSLYSMSAGDLLDNDCDGKIDEESENKRDDDGDTLVDEDLRKPPRRSGAWGVWGPWGCTERCANSSWIRERFCDDPEPVNGGEDCVGENNQIKTGLCVSGILCPGDCPAFKFDYGCAQDCSNCDSECDKFNGSCVRCKPGYSDHGRGCQKACPQGTYGLNCSRDCYQKCDADCVERITGSCPTGSMIIYFLVAVSALPIVATLIIYIVARYRKKRAKADEDDQSTVNTKIDTVSSFTSVATGLKTGSGTDSSESSSVSSTESAW